MEFLQNINNNYAAVLSLITSVLMVIVTIVYVLYTKKQADYSKKSLETVITQIKVEKQPCIVPSIIDSYGSAFKASDHTRMQLAFTIRLDNCGDAPATNIFTFAFIELQNIRKEKDEKILLKGSLLPDTVHAIVKEDSITTSLHFETREIKLLLDDLSSSMDKNWERLKTNPYLCHIHGPNIIIKVFYRNIMGQWYTSSLTKEIAWLDYIEPKARKTHNLNENTIPPKTIKEGDEYKTVLVSDKLAPFSYHMTDEETVKKYIKLCEPDNPWVDEIIKGLK